MIQTVMRDEFVLDGPLQLPTQQEKIVITRFPIYCQASECSCASSFPTANDVLFRTGKAIGLFQEPGGDGMAMEPPPSSIGGSNVSSLFTYGKLSDYRDRFDVEEGRRFPTEVSVFFHFSSFLFFSFLLFVLFCFLFFSLSSLFILFFLALPQVVFQTKEDDLPTMFCDSGEPTVGDYSSPSIERSVFFSFNLFLLSAIFLSLLLQKCEHVN